MGVTRSRSWGGDPSYVVCVAAAAANKAMGDRHPGRIRSHQGLQTLAAMAGSHAPILPTPAPACGSMRRTSRGSGPPRRPCCPHPRTHARAQRCGARIQIDHILGCEEAFSVVQFAYFFVRHWNPSISLAGASFGLGVGRRSERKSAPRRHAARTARAFLGERLGCFRAFQDTAQGYHRLCRGEPHRHLA
jgi:hypothetical protein